MEPQQTKTIPLSNERPKNNEDEILTKVAMEENQPEEDDFDALIAQRPSIRQTLERIS